MGVTPVVSTSAVATRIRGVPAWLGQITGPYPPGHWHSPLPDLEEVRRREAQLFTSPATLPGIDLRTQEQLALLPEFAELAAQMPFELEAQDGLRYQLRNKWFANGDGVVLYCMLRKLKPARYVEIGSGWSSALALDVNDLFLGKSMKFTFIEPNPSRLHSLLRPGDDSKVCLIEAPLFAAGKLDVGPGDVLFIDSSHVSRIGSDVNQLFLDVIPSLPAGVHVHIHDIFYPFEYPRKWVYRGRAWNEAYVLRALLTNNDRLRITWFNSYLGQWHREAVGEALPHWAHDPGSSIWLETR
ncbi:class I SAM-dependent methyltransferase [Catelliglobosispora koreensis]|uniref:class I SAM-dependent methyltransferase n=1 Tax=Catelliglobosispora koreensis TaxID=129052 RepID=UPI0003AB06CC|nr:class I SAM-dependent methyltransferase [Catelliglobosispora koreensis]